MPPVSVELKKQVKAANDVVDVISGYLSVVPTGKTYKCLCPFHNDTRPSMVLDRTYQNFRCWACDARGDVFDFVMKFEKVAFPEALRILAARAGIKLETEELTAEDHHRKHLLDVLKWTETQYTECYFDDMLADAARKYIGERKLAGATVRQFGLGFAPMNGSWLAERAEQAGFAPSLFIETGLIAERDEGRGFYDRFRDRVIFPIRDIRGQTVGFGGRILPSSPMAARGPKYYNSPETVLFKKQELIYGLDVARHAGAQAGTLAVVEGYTDVMMAHQFGINNVVATMGTALNLTHVMQLRRYVPKVVLVFDSDEAGESATDKSQGLFWAQHDFEIAVCTLPEGLDPCDLLVKPGGPEVFKKCLNEAKDVHEFKIDSLLKRHSTTTLEGQRRIMDASLAFLALAESPSAAAQMKIELAVTRLAHRLGLRQETVWARLGELKAERRRKMQEAARFQEQARREAARTQNTTASTRTPTPVKNNNRDRAERQLLEILLAEPVLVIKARERVVPSDLSHTGLARMLTELYALLDDGMPPDSDSLRVRMLDRPDLVDAAIRLQEVGRGMSERATWLERVLNFFDEFHTETEQQALMQSLAGSSSSDEANLELLRKLQQSTQKPEVAQHDAG